MMKNPTVKFLGGAGTVTGSKYLLTATNGKKVMIDCGLFQGLKVVRELNWEPLQADPYEIDAVVLTHAHLDHTGYLPRLGMKGFNGPIFGTTPTIAIAEVVLLDAAKLQEEEARMANEQGYSKHKPAKPLYETKDVLNILPHFKDVETNNWINICDGFRCRWHPNGHILGACFVEIVVDGKTLIFSGDIGPDNDLLLADPEKPIYADYVFIESTYGDRLHAESNPKGDLEVAIKETSEKNGVLIIPAFAVERSQTLMYLLWQLAQENKLLDMPVYLDSPMSAKVVDLFAKFSSWHKLSELNWHKVCQQIEIIEDYQASLDLLELNFPRILIAGSGMSNGGRVLNYMEKYIANPDATILITGYQAEGTRGRQLIDGAEKVKFKGEYYEVKAQIKELKGLSAHADQNGLLNWLGEITNKPKKVFIVHGEGVPADALRLKIEEKYYWTTEVAQLNTSRQLV